MLRKGLAVVVILLFIGVAIAPTINATQEPIPDLDCDGSLSWVDVEPGATVTGSFTVENIGAADSELNWEIESYPEWGIWTFDPNHGENLTPEDGAVTVSVEVIWPKPENVTGGEVVLANSENPDDICIIDMSIPPPPPPPPSFPITLIGKISNLEVHNESISFHADFVLTIFIIIPAGILINEDMTIDNDYRGFIGSYSSIL